MDNNIVLNPKVVEQITSLGRTIRIGSKSKVDIQAEGSQITFEGRSAHIPIKIDGKSSAVLVMTEEAFFSLNPDSVIEIDTIQQHIKIVKTNGRKQKK